MAQSAHLRLKTLRHPNILKYIDGIEVGVVTNRPEVGVVMLPLSPPLAVQLPTAIYVVTEEALPLQESIATKDGATTFSIAWGLHQTMVS